MTYLISSRTLAILAGLALLAPSAASMAQAHFPTPEAAAQALIDAAIATEPGALTEVLGPAAVELASGDPVADAAERAAFVDAAVSAAGIELAADDGRATLVIGDDDWPFPLPLVRGEQGWSFDTEAGLEEVHQRRIGRNELHAIAFARAYAEAQQEYHALDPDGDGVKAFARRIASGDGARDGLYWPVAEGEPTSPLGPLVSEAIDEGYTAREDGGPARPYHGYFYRLLEAQGPHARGGARSYLADGKLTGGFGLLAWPAEYGNSGIMTFMVNRRGIVFEKDLGEETAKVAAAITAYDPDRGWRAVKD